MSPATIRATWMILLVTGGSLRQLSRIAIRRQRLLVGDAFMLGRWPVDGGADHGARDRTGGSRARTGHHEGDVGGCLVLV
jgi:hypothetical protein